MYYLIIQNLGIKSCIAVSGNDVYTNGMHFNCTNSQYYPGGLVFLRNISIYCTGINNAITASVYKS